MNAVSSYLNVSILGIEYPGYGMYQDNGAANEAKIKQDAEYVYHYVL
jgi:hypothetical protein